MDRLAIVVPCYNEEEVLKLASKALRDIIGESDSEGEGGRGQLHPLCERWQ